MSQFPNQYRRDHFFSTSSDRTPSVASILNGCLATGSRRRADLVESAGKSQHFRSFPPQ
jgi:hypothetical protein